MMKAGLCLLPRLLSPARGLGQIPQPGLLTHTARLRYWDLVVALGMGGGESLPLAFPSKGNLNSKGCLNLADSPKGVGGCL